MDAIGGYFELELRTGEHFHRDAIMLNTGRNCLEYILRVRGYKEIYIPYYTCDVILEPILKLGIKYYYYHIDEKLDPIPIPSVDSDTAFLYTNYYGLKQSTVEKLSNQISNLIIDNSQAFFAKRIEGIDTFYSPRKFFGVADGAYLFTDVRINDVFEIDTSYNRYSHLLKRIDLGAEIGYSDFIMNDKSLENQPIKLMSRLTSKLLRSIDYEYIEAKRVRNFNFLNSLFKEINLLKIESNTFNVPMVYPLLINKTGIKEFLISKKIYIPTYWKSVLGNKDVGGIEKFLANNLLALPIDQRYDKEQLDVLYSFIKKNT